MPSISTPGRRDKNAAGGGHSGAGEAAKPHCVEKDGMFGEDLGNLWVILGKLWGLDWIKANFGRGNQKMDMEESHQFVFGITNKSNK